MKTIAEMGLDYHQAQDYCRRNHCIACGLPIVVAQNAQLNTLVIKCADPTHGPEDWGRGPVVLNIYQEANIRQRRLKELSKQIGEEGVKTLATAIIGSMTEPQAMKIIETLWPGAPIVEKQKASILCAAYNLDPLRKHVYLIPYKNTAKAEALGCHCAGWPCPHIDAYDWSMQMGIGATRLIVGRYADFSYVEDTPRIMTDDEQRRIRGKVDAANYWAVVKLFNTRNKTTSVGYGNYPKVSKGFQGESKGNTRESMAMIRAERQALDRMCQGKLPDVDVFDERMMDLPAGPYKIVDSTTGAIIGEGTATIQPPAGQPAQPAQPSAQPAQAAIEQTAPEPETCPIPGHEGCLIVELNFANSKTKGHVIEGELTANNKPKYCTTFQVENWRKKAEKAVPAGSAVQPVAPPAETPAAAPAKEIEGQVEQGDTGPDSADLLKQIDGLAESIWGKEYGPELNRWLNSNYGYKSRKEIKEAQRSEVVAKLNGILDVKLGSGNK